MKTSEYTSHNLCVLLLLLALLGLLLALLLLLMLQLLLLLVLPLDPRLELGDLLAEVDEDGLARGELLEEELAVVLLELDADAAAELELAGALARVLLVLHDRGEAGVDEDLADLHVVGVLHALVPIEGKSVIN